MTNSEMPKWGQLPFAERKEVGPWIDDLVEKDHENSDADARRLWFRYDLNAYRTAYIWARIIDGKTQDAARGDVMEERARHIRGHEEVVRERQEKEQQSREKRKAEAPYRIPEEFYRQCPVVPSTNLAGLRKEVLSRSEKRSPKWKFRLAEDLVLQIQPKLTEALLKFECAALWCEDPAETKLIARQNDIKGLFMSLKFVLTAKSEDEWQLKVNGYRKSTKVTSDIALSIRQRIVNAFETGWFNELIPDKMLEKQCIFCGKGLTDPVSMARLIGPECYGSSSPDIPWIFGQPKIEETVGN